MCGTRDWGCCCPNRISGATTTKPLVIFYSREGLAVAGDRLGSKVWEEGKNLGKLG